MIDPIRKIAYRAVIQWLIDTYPGMYLSTLYMQSRIIADNPTQYAARASEVLDYLIELRTTGEMLWKKGPKGGILLQWQTPGATTPTSASADNYTCATCGNKKLSTHTDRSCWSCGTPVQK